MRISLLLDPQLPRPWRADGEARALAQALELAELADRLGYDGIWAPERHFQEERAHRGAAEAFLAAASQRTSAVRLGLGPVLTAPVFQHPARVAQGLATLDLLSGGRAVLATSQGTAGAELGGFGIDRATRGDAWRAGLEAVARLLVEEPFAGAETDLVAMPPRSLVPRGAQHPHPPLFAACARREDAAAAGELGLGVLGLGFVEPGDARGWVGDHRAAIASERCAPLGFSVTPDVALALPMLVHADEAEAIARGIDGLHFLAYAQGHFEVFGEHAPGRTNVWEAFEQRRAEVGLAREPVVAEGAPLAMRVLHGGRAALRGGVGTPAQVRELVTRYEETGVDELVLCLPTARTRHEHVVEALELFAAEVLPGVRERQTAHEVAKGELLGDAIPRALARRAPAREAGPGARFTARDSGAHAPPPGPPAPAPARQRRRTLPPALRDRGLRALRAYVARSDDRHLERTVGSPRGQRALFAAMAGQFDPEQAAGFTGDLRYELRDGAGRTRTWTLIVDAGGATAVAGARPDPKLTLKLGAADFVRVAAGELDPAAALLSGRMDLEGDFGLAMRLGAMFGRPTGF